ncbi:MAG TPA: hypothetical protein VGI17_03215 [Solirubrobacterales bacterium]|jgi:hypothetical protein
MSTTHRSQRFALAATNERNRLLQKRARVAAKRQALQERLQALDSEIESMDEEIVAIEAFVAGRETADRESDSGPAAFAEDRREISGGAIRALAVPLLLRERGPGPIHYTDWAGLLRAQGLEIAGKRPDAVFLSQVSRSPLVRATTKAGYYEIDLDAPRKLEDELRRQKTKLATAMIDDPKDPQAAERHREARRELQLTISRTERELAEARTALEEFEADQASSARAA